MLVDKTYWATQLESPYSPSDDDINIYLKYKIQGSSLLLGCTHKLLIHTDYQLDIDPWFLSKNVIVGDWRNNKIFYNNIMGDGVLNFTEELTNDVLKMASTHCNRFVVRYFNERLPNMKIANYFTHPHELYIKPDTIEDQSVYSFLIWNFHAKNFN